MKEIGEIESYDYFHIISLIKDEKYDELKEFIKKLDVNINCEYFLRDIAMRNNKKLVLFCVQELNADFRIHNDFVFKCLEFMGRYNEMLSFLNSLYFR